MKGKIRRIRVRKQTLAALMIVVIAAAISWSIVRSANQTLTYVPKSLAECQQATNKDYQCYAKYYATLAYEQGNTVAFDDMKAAYETDGFVKAECHQLSHVVGRTSFEKTGSLEKAYADGNNFCWSGFYHGAIEHAIAKLGSDKIKQNTANICESFAKKEMYSFNHFNCVHGLGHGLMAVAGYNLHEGLKYCDNTKTSWEKESCYGGAFMENVMVASRGDGTSAYLDPARPLYPCSDVAYTYKQQCYLMQTSYILQHNGYDFTKTFQECAKADADFVQTCYQSAGRDASGSTNSDPVRTVEHCRKGPDYTAIRNCMLGADRDFVSYYHDDKKALQLCEAFGEGYVEECKSDVANYYRTF
jgi:hypothetical protein